MSEEDLEDKIASLEYDIEAFKRRKEKAEEKLKKTRARLREVYI